MCVWHVMLSSGRWRAGSTTRKPWPRAELGGKGRMREKKQGKGREVGREKRRKEEREGRRERREEGERER